MLHMRTRHWTLSRIRDSNKVWVRRAFFKEYDLERQMETDSRNRALLQRIPNDATLMTRLPLNVLAALVMPFLIHSTVHLRSLNFTYPSRIEQLLWRISAIILASLSAVGIGIIHMLDSFDYQADTTEVGSGSSFSWNSHGIENNRKLLIYP